MPESNNGKRKRGGVHPLSKAAEIGQLVRVTCAFCRIVRHYQPSDLQELIGDVDVDGIQGRMRCEKCGRRDYMAAVFLFPTARELAEIRVRRLVGIKMIRKVIWRDDG
jgi:hypothetical protein